MNKKIFDKLQLDKTGHYDDSFYVVDLDDSNEYAKMYTLLSKNVVNTEYPNFEVNTNKTTIGTTNYFELTIDNTDYDIFLFANFQNDKYYIKIGEK